jgi:hypothetical protein
MHLNSKPPTTVYGHPGSAIAEEVGVGLGTVHRIRSAAFLCGQDPR